MTSNKFANEPRLSELVSYLQSKHSGRFQTQKGAEEVVSTVVEFIRSTSTDGAFLHAFAQWCRAEQIERLEDSRIAEAAAADVNELEQAIGAVRRIQEDYQAISWKTHDNEREVLAALALLMQYVPQAEPDSAHLRTFIDCKCVETLLAYFEADSRRDVRVVVMQLLGSLTAVSPASATRAMALVLPPLLCTDILSIVAVDPLDAEWLMFSALLLTCSLNAEQDDGAPLFSSLSTAIIPDVSAVLKCFLDLLEKGAPDATSEIDGSAVDSAVLACLLTINTKLARQDLLSGADDEAQNDTLRLLLSMESSQRFTQLLLTAFNESAGNPVLFAPTVIFVRDLLVHPVACHMFYYNDLCVLVDVILRHMSNIAQDHPQRYQLLEMCFGLVRNCDLVKLDYKLTELSEVVRWQAEHESADERNAPLAAAVLDMLTRKEEE